MLKRSQNYRFTFLACFCAYVVQATVNTFSPLLFVTFQKTFGVSLEKISLLITVNFTVQLAVDLLCAAAADRIGYRTLAVGAHVLTAAGLAGLALLPALLPSPYAGLLLAVVLYAAGGGMIEVVISPIVAACPSGKKSAAMNLLHSFYCWGLMFAIVVSTLFFRCFGIENWRTLSLLWALIPLANGILFLFVPIAPLTSEDAPAMPLGGLLRSKLFWLLFFIMLCAGAAEQAVVQWSSAMAELALRVPKAVGDLAGPCAFALCMGVARVMAVRSKERDMERLMLRRSLVCAVSYLLISLVPLPGVNLAGCALCGFAVSIIWPSTLGICTKYLPQGGTALFALLALSGDIGCSLGPTVVGFAAERLGGDLKRGVLTGIVFALGMALGLAALMRRRQQSPKRTKI
ncbi:MAG: MFS transporter [Oscillospiraceae bacterium]